MPHSEAYRTVVNRGLYIAFLWWLDHQMHEPCRQRAAAPHFEPLASRRTDKMGSNLPNLVSCPARIEHQ
jgi:hypothetical protein